MYLHGRQLPLPVLPEELILQILARLPVRTLLQFRCVCKSWKTLISDPQFAKSHLQGSTDESIMTHLRLASFVITEPYEVLSYPLKTLFENSSTPVEPDSFSIRHEYSIIDSCNGLLCLFDRSQFGARLFNPATRLMSKKSPPVVEFHWYYANYGFGYDQVNDKYKFLIAFGNRHRNFAVKIYTFGEESWTTIQNFPCTPRTRPGKFVSGTLNWLADKGASEQCVILSFDLVKESYEEVLLPQIDIGYSVFLRLYVINNCLCVFGKPSQTHWVMWSMKEYGVAESWTKLMFIPLEKCVSIQEFTFNDFLFISKNGIVLLVESRSYKLSLYNINSGEPDFDHPLISRKIGFDRQIYRESLVSPHR